MKWLLVLLILPCLAHATDYYANPTDQGNNCTFAAPCGLNEAMGKAFGGDTVLLKDGTYSQSFKTVRGGTSNSARITFRAVNRHQAIVRYAGSAHSHFHIDHSWITVSGLRINAETTGGSNASDATKISDSHTDHAPIQGVIFEDNYVQNAGHSLQWTGNSNGAGVEVRNNTFDVAGQTAKDGWEGEGNYWGSFSTQNPGIVNFHHNITSHYKANAVDFKGEYRDGYVHDNFFIDHDRHTCSSCNADCTHDKNGSCMNNHTGDGQFVIGCGTGDPCNDSSTNNRIIDNVIFRPRSKTLFAFVDNVQIRANGNVFVDWTPTTGTSDPQMNAGSGSMYTSSTTHSNLHCPSEGMTQGLQTNGSNPANQINQPIAECNDRIDEIVGIPRIVGCNIGQQGNTTVTVDVETNKNPPVHSEVGAIQVTYNNVAQTENSVFRFTGQQVRITMATPPSSSATVRVVAPDGVIKNSAYIGGKTCGNGDNFGITNYTRGQGFCGENEEQTVICTNTVTGGEPPPAEALSQSVWRFYARHGAEGERPMAAENANITAYEGDILRWRVAIRGGGANAASRGYTLASRLCNPSCGVWVEVSDDMSATGVGFAEDLVQEENVATTNQLSLGGKTFVAGRFIESEDASIPAVAIQTTQQVEWEYSLQFDRSGPAELGDRIELAMRHDDGTEISSYLLPSITITSGGSSVGGSFVGTLE